jgi:hypothetical protein
VYVCVCMYVCVCESVVQVITLESVGLSAWVTSRTEMSWCVVCMCVYVCMCVCV